MNYRLYLNLKYWYYKNYKLFENINIVQGETNIERLKRFHGDKFEEKYLEIKQKISKFAKERVRKKVKCDICGVEISDTHIKRHKAGKNCSTKKI